MSEGIQSIKLTLIGVANSVVWEAVPVQREVAESFASDEVTSILDKIKTALETAQEGTAALREKYAELGSRAKRAEKTVNDANDRLMEAIGRTTIKEVRYGAFPIETDSKEIIDASEEIPPLVQQLDEDVDPIQDALTMASSQIALLEVAQTSVAEGITERIGEIAGSADAIKAFAEGLGS